VAYIKLDKSYTLAEDRPIRSPDDAVAAIAEALKELDREVVCMVTLKSDNTPINASVISVGTLDVAVVYPREVMKMSILSNATKIMLFHNHPSGGALPSIQDIQLTDRIKQCCDLMDITFLDHIIIGAMSKEWFSFNEKGMIKPFDLKYAKNIDDINLNDTAAIDNVEELAKPVELVAEEQKTYHNTHRR
jgi:DNA repair protein RadC